MLIFVTMGNKEKLTSHNDAITTGLEDNEAVLSYLKGGYLNSKELGTPLVAVNSMVGGAENGYCQPTLILQMQ